MRKMRKTVLLGLVLFLFLPWSSIEAATPLEACGYHDLHLVMEQLPASWSPWYGRNNDYMWLYNQYMDIYRYVDDDGSWGRNLENEFGGWPSDADLYGQWGFHWNSYLALTCWRWYCECCEIIESDVLFNPAYSWTADKNYAENNPSSVIYYDSVLVHELGHSWGMQTRNETYDYNEPTVMHSYNRYSVQDQMMIHVPEAWLIRRHYDDQTSIIGRNNMAVVSKYASGSWRNATTNASSYFAGDQMSVYDLTVENTGTSALSNVHIRLYLSSNRIISTSDTQIGDWYWTSFPAEAYGVYDFTNVTIPSGLAAGTYYVGAMVTINGYSGDDLSWDNTTHLWNTISVARRSITVTTPNGGETWFVGDTRNITWSSSNAGSYVKIDLSRNGGSTWSTITSSTANDGVYAWYVTSPTSSSCRIRVTSTSYPYVTDTSNANFTIASRWITVRSPNGGETWGLGETRDITWSSSNAGSYVKIELSRNGGSTWSIITNSTPNDGAYSWSVTGPVSSSCRVRITSTSYSSVTDTSDANFAIVDTTGYLKGTIWFTGLPCQAGGPVPPCEGLYPRYTVVVYESDGTTVAGRTVTDANGNYSMDMPAGDYVCYEPSGPFREEKHSISIVATKTTVMDMRISTGVAAGGAQ